MIFDSYAWVEYLFGTEQGKRVDELIEKNNCYTLESNLAEIYDWSIRQNQDFETVSRIISSKSEILQITRKDWLRATEIKLKMRKTKSKFGIIDALTMAKQEELKCKIVTGDPHFKGEKNIIFLS